MYSAAGQVYECKFKTEMGDHCGTENYGSITINLELLLRPAATDRWLPHFEYHVTTN